mmetsp:Transcript_54/g.117  ORF Transcript_54/g.117 Transcript_54/m.117 type:complete len:392 (+) Transcript_54:116-1291(+)
MNRFFAFLALAVMASPSAAFTVPTLSAHPTALNAYVQQEIKPIPDDYVIPEGYVGGFEESKPQYAYTKEQPNLDDIPIMGNMENIDKLDRQQNVIWPEFSWMSKPGDPTSRVYQRFANNVSRLGYSNDGRVYSIICPQQGLYIPHVETVNVEVTVTGVRGWCNEPEKSFYADMGVTGTVWFGENRVLEALADIAGYDDFPFSKDKAIIVQTNKQFEPWNPIFQVLNGTTTDYPIPQDRQHWDDGAYSVGHINVEIGEPKKTGDEKIDELNTILVKIFNMGTGNKLLCGNTLSWNLWMAPPELVDREEWQNHADYWRESIDVQHHYPGVKGNVHDYVSRYDGSTYGLPQTIGQDIATELHLFAEKWKTKKHEKHEGVLKGLETVHYLFAGRK